MGKFAFFFVFVLFRFSRENRSIRHPLSFLRGVLASRNIGQTTVGPRPSEGTLCSDEAIFFYLFKGRFLGFALSPKFSRCRQCKLAATGEELHSPFERRTPPLALALRPS